MGNSLSRREVVLIVLLSLMLIAVVTLSVLLGITTEERKEYKMGVENVYRHAYYALMENYVDIESNLSKIKVIRSNNMLEQTLAYVASNSSLASLSLSTLNTENNDLTSIYKFTNQVSDYSRYLIKNLQSGKDITEGERNTLDKMYDISCKIGDALASVKDRVTDEGYLFVDSLGKEEDIFSVTIRELNSGSIEYPALIYDGPFSDGIHDITPKNLTGEELSIDAGIERIKGIFEGVSEVNFISENTNKFTSYLYDIRMSDGTGGTIQISKTGGHILMFTCYCEDGEVACDEESARAIGTKFLAKHGYRDMRPVYTSLANGAYYINYAPVVDDVVYYPDLVKVKISSTNGKIVGIEGMNYIYNHTDRELDMKDIKSLDEIVSFVPSDVEIQSVRLALIPKDVNKEILTYEIIASTHDSKYYIYLDAKTASEVNVLMEICGGDGNLLI